MTETLSPVLPDALEREAHAVMRRVCDAGLSIATAESCTGGLLASLLTDVEGASSAFERGYVTYAKDAKCELLGVARDDAERCEAVNREVAVAMARGALEASHADVALAVTGFAGPAGEGNEAGLVHLACVDRNGALAHREEHFGDIGRGPTRLKCLEVAVRMLDDAVDRLVATAPEALATA